MILNADRLRARLEKNTSRSGGGFFTPAELTARGVKVEDLECLFWLGARQGAKSGNAGQLSVRVNGAHRKLIVHRLALWLKEHPNVHGRVRLPDRLPLARQTCGNRTCIEPSHLERKTS